MINFKDKIFAILIFLVSSIVLNLICYIPLRSLVTEEAGLIMIAITVVFNVLISRSIALDYLKQKRFRQFKSNLEILSD